MTPGGGYDLTYLSFGAGVQSTALLILCATRFRALMLHDHERGDAPRVAPAQARA